ncbi:hypothetical protein HN51_023273 [Arachis hypogaea]|uniref:Bromo domain-containing protein n=1 Tax=Arachis hypogaea TaxID=3818 RepID=A0A445E659_ARAHY|nr:transcription factor GTE5, chloroplastic-like [Arachis hypogaea]RYR70849.1 hypothetical protein Ahy_A02g005152 [Arachis hypogaea]RYR70853.1 hypothetical protein Ahy_A02g005157 [Arachis hypogaea]
MMFCVPKPSTFVPPKKSSDVTNKRVPKKRVFSELSSHVDRFNNNNNNGNSVVLDSRANKRAKVEKSEENSRMKKGTTTDAVKEHEDKKKRGSSSMDSFKNMQCSATLKRLLLHPDGVYFKKGKALMDLERVQRKLWNNLYNKTDQFAADIRTVFRNVMSQYPSEHEVHQTAAKLSDLFETKWKNLERRWLPEKENKLEKEEPKPLKSNAGEKRKQLSHSDFSTAIAKARVYLQRKKQREMMQKMERTISFDDAFKSFQDLEKLCGHSLTHYWTKKNPLLKNLTGLVLREEDFEDNNFLSKDLEEGEVF